MQWAPGQHVFLRFWALGLNAYTSHPFTICSLPDSKEMVFYIRPQAGITARLKTLIETKRGFMPMSIDGPYGDRDVASKLARYSSALLVAGGSGAGFLFPVLESVFKTASKEVDVRVVIAVRHMESASWISEAVDAILGAKSPKQRVDVKIYITDEVASAADVRKLTVLSGDFDEEKAGKQESNLSLIEEKHTAIVQGKGRPDLKSLIAAETTNGMSGGVGVVGCGPAGMMRDVNEACVESQIKILKGESGAREVWLHTEAFSW